MIQFFMCFLVLFSALQGEIVEIAHIGSVAEYASPDMLIVFDIDNTLIEPSQELGTDQWFYNQIQRYLGQNMSYDEALDKALSEWQSIQYVTKVNAIEPACAPLVKYVQDEGFDVIGLTTRGLELAHKTISQLKSVNIDLARAAPSLEEIHFMNGIKKREGVLYKSGILFTSATQKGTALFTLLEKIGYTPKSILFINDKASHLREVEVVCEEKQIPFLGLRYGFTDEKVKNFRRDLADIQFQNFGSILSNEEASQALHTQKE